MLMIYDHLTPLRILEEVRFWKIQEKDQVEALLAMAPRMEPQFQQLLTEWKKVLEQSAHTAQRWIDSILEAFTQDRIAEAPIIPIIDHASQQSQELVRQLFLLCDQSQAIVSNATCKTAVTYFSKVSEYYIGTMIAFLKETKMTAQTTTQAAQPQSDTTSHPTSRADVAGLTSTFEGSWSEPISQHPVPIGGHKLPPLPYDYDALEPHIDETTMKLHHQKHHQSYVDGLNQAENKLEEARESGDYDLLKHWQKEAAFHGAGHYLHSIFWYIMSPHGGGKANGAIAAQINKDFGSFERFKQHFTAAAVKVEGNGWSLLVWSPRSHRLEILQAEKHQNLSQWDVIPLLVLDVWEHAYYVRYQNKRADYVDAWWNVVHWDHVNERFVKARQLKWMPY